MSILTRGGAPVRLTGIFLASAAAFGLVAAAAGAVLYIASDMRTSEVAGVSVGPDGHVEAPAGLVVLLPVEGEAGFRDLLGFPPFLPSAVPETTSPDGKLYATQPDDYGVRSGYVVFPALPDAEREGITGPAIRFIETRGFVADQIDGQLQRIESGAQRIVVANVSCGDLALRIEFFFGPDAQPDEPIVTPYMQGLAKDFVSRVRGQCGSS